MKGPNFALTGQIFYRLQVIVLVAKEKLEQDYYIQLR